MEQITTLELQIISATHLKDVNLIGKMDVYVVVSLSDGAGTSDQKTKTTVDRDGGTNPTWDFPMKFTVTDSDSTLVFKLKCDRTIGGDRVIGEVNVPVKDILGSGSKQKFVCYQVRKPSGRPQGSLNFSYRVIGPSINKPNGLTGPSQQEEDRVVITGKRPHEASEDQVSNSKLVTAYPVIGPGTEELNGPIGPSGTYTHRATTGKPPSNLSFSDEQVSKLVTGYPVVEPSTEVYVGLLGPSQDPYTPRYWYTYPPPPPTQPMVYGGYHPATPDYGYLPPPPPPPGYGYPAQGGYAYSSLGRYVYSSVQVQQHQ